MRRTTVALLFLALFVVCAKPDGHDGHKGDESIQSDVVVLSQENWDQTKTGKWFIKFYAPWCGHCKSLAPIWEIAASMLSDKANFAKVDCTVNEVICSDYGVKGFPTLKFFDEGVPHEYSGLRETENFENYITKMSTPAFSTVLSSDEAVNNYLVSSESSKFLLFGEEKDKGTFQNLVNKFRATVDFAYVNNPSLMPKFNVQRTPALVVVSSDNTDILDSDFDKGNVEKFIGLSQFGLLPELGPNNFNELQEQGVPLVIVVINPNNADQIQSVKEEAKAAARSRKGTFTFSWLDGDKWKNYVEGNYKLQVQNDAPATIVLDTATEVYYFQRLTYSEEDFSKFLNSVIDGTAEAIALGPPQPKINLFNTIEKFAHEHLWLAVGSIFVLGFFLGYLSKRAPQSKQSKNKVSAPQQRVPSSVKKED